MNAKRTVKSQPPWTHDLNLPCDSQGRLTVPSWDTVVSRTFVATFVEQRVPNLGESARARKDKIGKQFDTALENEQLPSAQRGLVRFDDVVRWLHSKPKLALAVDGLLPPTSGTIEFEFPPVAVSFTGTALPQSLEESNRALAQSLADLRLLEVRKVELEQEVARLRPFEDKALAQSAKNQASGLKGGRPRRS